MSSEIRVFKRVMITALCLGAAPAFAAAGGKGWRVAHLEELTVYSQVNDGKTRDIVEDVARFRAVLAKLGVGTGASPAPLRLFLFESNHAYDPFKPATMEKQSTGGHFQVTEFGHQMALNAYPDRGSALPVVYHEYVHEYLHSYYSELPLWMDEGLAEFYGTFRIEGGEAHLGLPQVDEIRWLREHSLIPLARLFAVDHQSPEYLKGEDRTTLYAESWLLVHYLMVGSPDGATQAGKYRALVAGGTPIDKAFAQSFAMSFAELEGKLRGYLGGRVLSYLRMPLADLPKVDAVRLADVPQADALVRLSMLLARQGDSVASGAAGRMIDDALELDSNLGDAVLVRAVLAQHAGNEAEARALFDRAATLPLQDAASAFLLGSELAERGERGVGNGAATGAPAAGDLERARVALKHALELQPGYAEALATLGLTYLRCHPPEPAAAIPYLEQAARALPGRPDFGRLLVQAQAAAGQIDRAKATLATLPGDAVAANVVARHERLKAVDDALAAGKVDDGLRLMREAVAAETDAAGRAVLQDQLTTLETQVAARRAAQAREQADVDAYNAALAAANAGRYAEARDTLRKLVESGQTPRVVEGAKKLLAEVEKRLGRNHP